MGAPSRIRITTRRTGSSPASCRVAQRTRAGAGVSARVDFGTGEDQVNDLVLQRGKPVAAGSIYGSLGVARFEP